MQNSNIIPIFYGGIFLAGKHNHHHHLYIITKIHQRLHHHHLEVVGDTSLSGASFSERFLKLPYQSMPYINKYKDSAVRSTIEIHLIYLLQIQRIRSQKYKRGNIYGKSEGSCLRKYVQMLKCQCSECSLRIDCIVFLSSNNFPPGKVGQIVDTPD